MGSIPIRPERAGSSAVRAPRENCFPDLRGERLLVASRPNGRGLHTLAHSVRASGTNLKVVGSTPTCKPKHSLFDLRGAFERIER